MHMGVIDMMCYSMDPVLSHRNRRVDKTRIHTDEYV